MSSFGSSASGSSSSVSSAAGPIHIESGSKSRATRRSLLSHPAILFLSAAAILFTAYALGYVPQFGSLLEAAIRSGRSTAVPALNPAFYGIAGLVAFLLLLAALRSIDMLLRRAGKGSSLANRPVKPLAEFVEEAAVAEISSRVARESYHLLQPYYPHQMCIELADDLRDHLRLEEEQIRFLDAKLLTRCDRRDSPSVDSVSDVSDLVTVFDLLFRVETAAPAQVERPSGMRTRATEVPVPVSAQPLAAQDLPVRDSRNPTSAQRKALHAAALHVIESRSLRIAETSGLHRRSSDYEGPRRRETDKSQDAHAYDGPYRRSGDLRVVRFGTSSSERKSEPDVS